MVEEINVMVMDNGMVCVFRPDGQQIPELQGNRAEAAAKIAEWVAGLDVPEKTMRERVEALENTVKYIPSTGTVLTEECSVRMLPLKRRVDGLADRVDILETARAINLDVFHMHIERIKALEAGVKALKAVHGEFIGKHESRIKALEGHWHHCNMEGDNATSEPEFPREAEPGKPGSLDAAFTRGVEFIVEKAEPPAAPCTCKDAPWPHEHTFKMISFGDEWCIVRFPYRVPLNGPVPVPWEPPAAPAPHKEGE